MVSGRLVTVQLAVERDQPVGSPARLVAVSALVVIV